jgi:MYXO-CTERM domain-containing protein
VTNKEAGVMVVTKWAWGVALALGLVASSWGCDRSQGVALSTVRQQPRSIINGTRDTNPAHAAVVFIEMTVGQGIGMCTGTLVDTRVVLTAAHCIVTSAAQTRVGFGSAAYGAQADMAWRSVASVHVHPNYQDLSDTTPPVNDIAIILLAQDPPAEVVPLPYLPASLAVTEADLGASLEVVGFGQTAGTGPEQTKLTVPASLRWLCLTPGGCTYPYQGSYVVGAQNTLGNSQETGGVCQGDSGGPYFISRAGTQYVAGVTSYGDQSCGVFAFATKVDAFSDFILPFISGALGSRCTLDDDCDEGTCVRNTCCATTCTETCMACDVPGSRGQCRPAQDGAPCPDADPCNGAETCRSGACQPGTPLACPPRPCGTGACIPLQGCAYTPVADDTLCADGDPCNGEETCQGGTCAEGTPPTCEDNNPCTLDQCSLRYGCRNYPLPDGTACDNGTQCDGWESCQGGTCVPDPSPPVCEDGNPCTHDVCLPESGCSRTRLPEGTPCADADPCNGEEVCQQGACQPGPALDCDDGDPCTVDACSADAGCAHIVAPDGTACGTAPCDSATCHGGQCGPTDTRCDDGDPCTTDRCDPAAGCQYDPAPGCLSGGPRCGCVGAAPGPSPRWWGGMAWAGLAVMWVRRRSRNRGAT